MQSTWALQTLNWSTSEPGWLASMMTTLLAEWVLVSIHTRLLMVSVSWSSFDLGQGEGRRHYSNTLTAKQNNNKQNKYHFEVGTDDLPSSSLGSCDGSSSRLHLPQRARDRCCLLALCPVPTPGCRPSTRSGPPPLHTTATSTCTHACAKMNRMEKAAALVSFL